MRARTNPLLALLRLLAIGLVSGFLYVAYLLRRLPLREPAKRFSVTAEWVQSWARVLGRLAGVRVSHSPPPAPPILLCPNHLGYVDVLALAAVTPCFFVSRADAADWPVLGPLIRASEQVLVSRTRSRDLAETSQRIAELLECGQSVVVFLEGTSTGGDRVLPFYPALLKPGLETGTDAVPVALTWSSNQKGVTVPRDIAYWGDHNFVTHLWRFLGIGSKQAHVEFGTRHATFHNDRAELARALRKEVLKMKGLPQ